MHFATRKEKGRPALACLLITSAPLVLWLIPSAFFAAFKTYYVLFPSIPSEQCALAAVCACTGVYGSAGLERLWGPIRERVARRRKAVKA